MTNVYSFNSYTTFTTKAILCLVAHLAPHYLGFVLRGFTNQTNNLFLGGLVSANSKQLIRSQGKREGQGQRTTSGSKSKGEGRRVKRQSWGLVDRSTGPSTGQGWTRRSRSSRPVWEA